MDTTGLASRLTNGRRARSALALAAVFACLAVAPGSGAARTGGSHGRVASATFTKWIVTAPADPSTAAGVLMRGIVGGDVGRGRYAGEVLSDDTTSQPGFWLAHARYEFYGRTHTFIAHLQITEDDRTPALITATIEGVVTHGWLKGAHVTGHYRQWSICPIATPGNVNGTVCFQGVLHLQR